MAGNLSVETCGGIFANKSRQASSNYGIGSDGRIGGYVPEEYRAWTSSSRANDQRAITVEVANSSTGGNWPVSDKAFESLVALAIDVCKRYGINRLTWTGNTSGNLTSHDMFVATNCMGPYLKSKMPELAKRVNAALGSGGETPAVPQTPTVSGGSSGTGFGGTYVCTVDVLRVRNAPSLSGAVMASYNKGGTVVLDDWYTKADGYIWGRYTGAQSGQKRYVAVGRATGKVEADDFLVKKGTSHSSTSGGSASSAVPAGTYRIVVDVLNVRTAPSTSAGVAAQYRKGQTVTLDGTSYVANGYVWGRYIGASSGKHRYIAVRTAGGTAYAAKV